MDKAVQKNVVLTRGEKEKKKSCMCLAQQHHCLQKHSNSTGRLPRPRIVLPSVSQLSSESSMLPPQTQDILRATSPTIYLH